jgi:hypothetical protein
MKQVVMTQIVKMPGGSRKDTMDAKDCLVQPEENSLKNEQLLFTCVLYKYCAPDRSGILPVLANKVRNEP